MLPGLPRHSMICQAADYPFCGQREVDLDPQPFAVEVVQHVQQPEGSAVAKAIVP
jgi:hypothetical protein